MRVSELVRNKARSAGAEEWLDSLPALVAELAAEWGFTLGEAFGDGTEAFVAAVTTAEGEPAVLKVVLPQDDGAAAAREAAVLRAAGGDGCARLLAHDDARRALLLERLGPSLHDLGLPFGRRLEILVSAARRLWAHPIPDDLPFPTGAEKAAWLEGYIARTWEDLDRPCSERAVADALACAGRRAAAHDDERSVLVHGDVHEWNALRSLTEPEVCKLVDPDGLRAEAEYDLGVLMREDPLDLRADLDAGDPRRRARRLAALGEGRDEHAIWEWGVVERVSTGLVCTSIGLEPVGRQMLQVAELVAR